MTEEFKLKLQAAKVDDLAAMIQVAEAYRNGVEVDQSAAEAFKWYKQADEYINKNIDKFDQSDNEMIGNIKNALGEMYEHGEGVERDYKIAAEYFNVAVVDYENIPARRSLGRKFLDGRGVEKDDQKAEILLADCDLENDQDEDEEITCNSVIFTDADEMLRLTHSNDYEDKQNFRLTVAKLPNSEQTLQWLLTIIDETNPNLSRNVLSVKAYVWTKIRQIIYHGDLDNAAKLKWCKKLVDRGNIHYAIMIGKLYYDSSGVEQNWIESAKYFQMVVDEWNRRIEQYDKFVVSEEISEALELLGKMYLNGEGVYRDLDKAFELFESAVSAAGFKSFEAQKLDDFSFNKFIPKDAMLELLKMYHRKFHQIKFILNKFDTPINF